MTAHPCSPRQQIYTGEPGATLVCPECKQAMRGIHYPYGIGLLTLPIHYDPVWVKNGLQRLRSERVLGRRRIRS